METELLVKGLGIERAVAACGEAGQLAEDNASVDVVQIDTNEVGVGAEPFGHVDHFAQASGLLGLAICPRRAAAERHVLPVGSEEVLRSSAEPPAIDLYERAFAVEDEEFVVIGDRTICIGEQLLDDDSPRHPPVHPLSIRSLTVELGHPVSRDADDVLPRADSGRTWENPQLPCSDGRRASRGARSETTMAAPLPCVGLTT